MEHSKPTSYPLPMHDKKSDWQWLQELRERDPAQFTCARIAVKWDTLDGVYNKQGVCAEFIALRKELKDFIRRNEKYADRINSYLDSHGYTWKKYK